MTRTRERRSPDSGFTLVESLVAIAVISVLMASLGTYFISTMKVSRQQAQIQAAIRIAQAGMESARGYGGPTLLVGRAQCGSCTNVDDYDLGYLDNTVRWDAAVSGVTPTVPIPNFNALPTPVVVNGVNFYRYFLVGKCWLTTPAPAVPTPKAVCGTAPTAVPMIRLVVGVTWTESSCKGTTPCIRGATALFSADPDNPQFTQS